MFIDINGIKFPKKLLFHVCLNNGQKAFYHIPDHLIPLGETKWPKSVKDKIVKIYQEIGIEEPLKQKLVEPLAWAFGGIKDISGDYNLDKVNWEYVVDYFKWEALAISEEADNDEFHQRAKELQERATKKYGSIFLHYLVYANPDHIKEVAPMHGQTDK
jgi:hypothetical protein